MQAPFAVSRKYVRRLFGISSRADVRTSCSTALARTAVWVLEFPLASVEKVTTSTFRPGSFHLLDNVTEIPDSPAGPDSSVAGPTFRDVVLGASSALYCLSNRSSG